MQTLLQIKCPACRSESIKKNGIKIYGKQNYQCKDCKRQFIGNQALTYNGCHSTIDETIRLSLVRSNGIRDIAIIQKISIGKILDTLIKSDHQITPKQTHYDCLEVDELWTYVGNKANKQWLVYAYHRATVEVVAYVWGKRDLDTVKKLRVKLQALGVRCARIASDNWDSFVTGFKGFNQSIGKFFTVGIEGNNCRIRHRIRRAFRKTCNFSKRLLNHFKAFDLTFFYIHYGFV